MASAASATASIVSESFVVQAPVASQDGILIGRNAYRSADEAVEVVYLEAVAEAPATQKCSAIEVAGAPALAVVLNRPAGIWGADSGANEKRVAIAVTWSHEALAEDAKLTATDLARLALERSATAAEAIACITALVAEHNADDVAAVQQCFIVAGDKEAWLLNVCGQLWAAERIEDGFRPVGAGLTVVGAPAKSSPDLQQRAIDLALWNGEDTFNFASVFATPHSAAVTIAEAAVAAPPGEAPFGLLELFALLREAAAATGEAHPSGWPASASQVLAVGIDGGGSTPVTCHWFTATPDPTESVFKPFVFTRNARISPLTTLVAGDCGDEPGESNTTRLHRLHAQRKAEKVGVLLRTLEESCVQEVHNFLSAAEAPVQELDELLKDCVEAEVKFYR